MSLAYLKCNITKESGRPVYNLDNKPEQETRKLCLVKMTNSEEELKRLCNSRYAVNIKYSIEQNKTMLFYIPEEYLEKESKSYVVQVKGKGDK